MKTLYEATNGWMGESYVRCYVWAESKERAFVLADEAFARENPNYKPGNISMRPMLNADSEEFASTPSDSGFEIDSQDKYKAFFETVRISK